MENNKTEQYTFFFFYSSSARRDDVALVFIFRALLCPLIRCCASNAHCCHTVANDVQLVSAGFRQFWGRRVAVDGVYHHLLWGNVSQCLQPGRNVGVGGVINILSFKRALHKHGLYDDVPFKRCQRVDDIVYRIVA